MRHLPHSSDPTNRAARSGGRGLLAALASAIAVLAVGGVVLTMTTLSASKREAAKTPVSVGTDLDTSYGHMRVTEVERADNMDMDMSAMSLPGMSDMDMGVNDALPMGAISITADVTLVNDTGTVAHASPDQFRLLREASSGETNIKPSRTTLAGAVNLPAHSSVDAKISFIVPSDGSALKLSYRDTPKAIDHTVDLGRTSGDAPLAPADPHHHH